jgi:hypothetical protein
VSNRKENHNIFIHFTSTWAATWHHARPPLALAENWGSRSLSRDHFFQLHLSPEDAVVRVSQTDEGLRT